MFVAADNCRTLVVAVVVVVVVVVVAGMLRIWMVDL